MTIDDLVRILRNAYSDGEPESNQVRNVHLFAIRYADELSRISKEELMRRAQIGLSGPTEINQGLKLSNCVGLTNDAIRMLEEADR